MKRCKSYKNNIVVWTLVLGLITLSIFIIVVAFPSPKKKNFTLNPIFQPDSRLIYSLKPNSIGTWSNGEFTEKSYINSFGFRDENLPIPANGVDFLVMVGDSNVYGHGISDNSKTLPKRVQHYLNSTSESEYHSFVLNAGIPGYSPDQEYRMIIEKIFPLNPKTIIWMLHMPNDYGNIIHSPSWPIPSLYDIETYSSELIPQDAKFNWLYFEGWLSNKLPILHNIGIVRHFINLTAKSGYFSNKPILTKNNLYSWALRKMLKEIDLINNYATQKNVHLYMIFFPYKEYIEGRINQNNLKFWSALKDSNINKGIKYLDLTDSIRHYASGYHSISTSINIDYTELYFKTDPHLNESGTDFLGRTIAEYLIKQEAY